MQLGGPGQGALDTDADHFDVLLELGLRLCAEGVVEAGEEYLGHLVTEAIFEECGVYPSVASCCGWVAITVYYLCVDVEQLQHVPNRPDLGMGCVGASVR